MAPRRTSRAKKACENCVETRSVLPTAIGGGLLLLFAVIICLVVLSKTSSTQKNIPLSPSQKEALPSMPGKGFFTLFGVVTGIDKDTITIRSVSPQGNTSSEVFYLLSIEPTTTITHQAVKDSSGKTPIYSSEPGKLTDIHKRDFLSVTTNDIISSVSALHVVTLDYSEASPFLK